LSSYELYFSILYIAVICITIGMSIGGLNTQKST